MSNMIKAELYRAFRHVAVYIALAVLALMIGMSIYTISPGKIGISVGNNEMSELADAQGLSYEQFDQMSISELREWMRGQTDYQLDRAVLAVNDNLYYVFLFIIAVVITVDFSSGCMKNTLSSEIGRTRCFCAKLCTVLLLCLALFFANTYLIYFGNLLFNGRNLASGFWEVTRITLLQLPAALMMISIPVGIAFVVKKTSVYNLVTIPFLMILQLICGYGVLLFSIPEKVFEYAPERMFARLAGSPKAEELFTIYLVCAVVSAVFLLAGYFSFRKTEIR